MVLKRKRSASELCSSPSSTSSSSTFSFSSPPHNTNNPFAFTMDPSPLALPAHLPSRTLKRFRDSRPADEEVHRKFYEWRAHHRRRASKTESSCHVPVERTLNLLYSAQQQHHGLPEMMPEHDQMAPEPAAPTSNQQSLHRFWNINSAPSSSGPLPGLDRQITAAAGCDDCGAVLGGGDEMELDGGAEDHSCGACGKSVCFSCSVSNLGQRKRCLQCAGRKVWIGGIGWTNAGVSVC